MFGVVPLEGGEGIYAATTGDLTLRPPATGTEGGEVTVAIDGFVLTGLGFDLCCGPFPNGLGGQVFELPLGFSSTGAEGDAFFDDAPEFITFGGEGELTSSVEGFEGGFGWIFGENQLFQDTEGGEGEVDFLVGASTECVGCFPEFFFAAEGDGLIGFGSYVAGQPTADISHLQAGNVTAEYFGESSLFGFDVMVEIDFQPAEFIAEFSDGGFFGAFAVEGTVNGSTFTSDTFLGAEGGGAAVVLDAGVNGTLFGPNAEAVGGVVGFEAEGPITGFQTHTFIDVFAATQEGVEMPNIAAPPAGEPN
jgi:hypothetical protein